MSADVARDLCDAKVALHLTGLKPSAQHENVVPSSVVSKHVLCELTPAARTPPATHPLTSE